MADPEEVMMLGIAVKDVLELLDRLVDLINARKRRKRELFSEIIEPIFAEVQPVVDEYFVFFQQARQELTKAKASDYRRLVHKLTRTRKDFQAVRVKVTQLARALHSQAREEPFKEFGKAVEDLFDATVISKPTRREKLPHKSPTGKAQPYRKVTLRKGLIEKVESAREIPVQKEALLRYIDEALEQMEEAFARVAAQYATLRLYRLGL